MALTGLTIRAPRSPDAAALAALLAELGYPAEPERARGRIERVMREARATALVAEDAGAPVGLATVHALAVVHADDVAQLTALVVTEPARRRGVGRALVEAAAAWARNQGCGRLTVAAGLERAAARAFYERLGFTRVGTYHALQLAP